MVATAPNLKLRKLMSQNITKNYSPPSWAFKVLFTVNQATSPCPFQVILVLDHSFKYLDYALINVGAGATYIDTVELDNQNNLKLKKQIFMKPGFCSYFAFFFFGMSVGAVARITCLKVDKHGYEMGSYSFLSGASDEKGYFFATLYPSEVEDDCKLKECKAFLESSPLETCDVPTDDNNGISGYPLDFYRDLSAKKMMLYSVKPFFYTPKPEPISNGY